MSPGHGQLQLIGGSESPFDFERAGLVEQAHDKSSTFFLRDRAFLSLTLRSLKTGDKPAVKKHLKEWAALIEGSGHDAASLSSRREFLKGLQLLADEDYLGAFRQFRQTPRSFSFGQLQKHFSAYWRQAHGSALIQVLSAATPHTRDEDVSFQNLRTHFQKTGNLRRAFASLEPAEQKWLRSRWSSESLEEIFTVSELKNPDAFMEDLLALASHWRGRGDTRQATVLLGLLEGNGSQDVFSYEVPTDVRKLAASLKSGGPFAPNSSWTRSLETTLASLSFSDVSHGVQSAGAWVGIATLACSYFRPLRPWAARGIYALSEPQVAALLLTTGAYTLYESAPIAGEALRRLTGPGSASVDDFFTLFGYSLGALAVGLGTASFAVGGKYGLQYSRAVRANDARPLEAWAAGYRQGDAARRAVQDPEVWVNYARSAMGLSPAARQYLGFAGKALDASLVKGSILYGSAKFAYGLHLYNEPANGDARAASLSSLLFRFGLDVFPATTIHLYRAGRGNRRFELGPALSQELNEAAYANPAYRERVLDRLDRSLPRLTVNRQDALITRARREFNQMEGMLDQAAMLTPLAKNAPTIFFAGGMPIPAKLASDPVAFTPKSHQPDDLAAVRQALAQKNLENMRAVYQSGEVSPLGVWRSILDHPKVRDGAIFPRELKTGPLGKKLQELVEESTRRWQAGKPRALEGIFVATKDLFPGVDGVMMGGTKTGRITGAEESPIVKSLLENGAIPLPVGMVAAANGGTGGHASFGYIPHPTREGYDPAGSSSGTAYVVGAKDFPVQWGIGTDTGGSTTAPAGAVGLSSIVPPLGHLSTQNMIPFATFLDRVGVLSSFPEDAQRLAQLLSRPVPGDPNMRVENPGGYFHPAPFAPRIVYLEELANDPLFTPTTRKLFAERMAALKREGWEVTALGKEWNFIADIPYLLYPWDAYPATAFAHFNPRQETRFEPPRRSLDQNLLVRLPMAGFSMREGYFDRARSLNRRYQDIMREKLGPGVLLASPSPEAVPTRLIKEDRAGDYLDLHDKITMAKNRLLPWGQINVPHPGNRHTGIALSGEMADLMHFMERPRLQAIPITKSLDADVPAGSPEHPLTSPVKESIVVPISSVRLRASRSRQGSRAEL